MKNVPLLLATLLGSLLFIFGIAFFFGKESVPEIIDLNKLQEGARHIKVLGAQPVASPSAAVSPASTESALATPSAQTVQIVEFSDFQCPACKAAAPQIKQLEAEFPGQIQFIYRHYPLTSIHDKAMLAAQAAESASRFNKFWEMHDKLFETQEEWTGFSQDEAKNKFIEFATGFGINNEEFTKLLESDEIKQIVQSDINLGNEVKISATPTFFLNGEKVPASGRLIDAVQQALQ